MTRREILVSLAAASAVPACAGLFSKSNMAEGDIFKNDAPKVLWKWSKEAMLYEKNGGKTKCLVCPNHCELSPGDRSACRVKVNLDGRAYTLAYGNPCALHTDPIEKKPLFHFHPGSSAFSLATAGCNLRCLNCQNWEISQKKPEELQNVELFPDAVPAAAKREACLSVAYTYSEPIAYYEYMIDTAKAARAAGLKNVWISNGYISRAGLEPLAPLIDGANINLKAFTEATYNELNGAHLKFVLETLKALKEFNVWFEVTTLMVPTYTDDMETVRGVADWILKNLGPGTPLHLSRFYPQHRLQHLPPTSVDKLVAAREQALKMGLQFVYVGNVPGLGLESTQCPGCRRTVIERNGFTVRARNIDIKGLCAFCKTSIPGRF